jgi:outer membrane lipase/esterase
MGFATLESEKTTPGDIVIKLNKLALAVTACCVSLGASAQTLVIDKVTSLGDSLTDGGTYSNAIKFANPLAPNINYRFTDNNPTGTSRTWAEVLAQQLGLTLVPNQINPVPNNGSNYAEGGSRVSLQPGTGYNPPIITTRTLTEQVNQVLADRKTFTDRDLITLWIGANDGFAQLTMVSMGMVTPTTGVANMVNEASNVSAQVDRLKAAGAKNIIVALLPDLANTPFGALLKAANSGGDVLLSTLSSQYNSALKSFLPAKDVLLLDSNKLLADVIKNPTKYGFNANTLGATACGVNPNRTGAGDFYNSSLTCISTNPNNYLFADGVHPSAKAQALFGTFVTATLRSVSQAASLATIPMDAAHQHAQSLESRMHGLALTTADGKARPVGNVQVYGGVEQGELESDGRQTTPATETTSRKGAIGLDRQIAAGTAIGAVLAYGESTTDFASGTGRIKTQDQTAMIYGVTNIAPNFYINASAARGLIDHTSFTRNIAFASNTLAVNSSPEGTYQSIRVGAGMIYGTSWKGGPYVSLAREGVKIKNFAENAGPASLAIGDINQTVRRLTIGFASQQAKPAIGQWRGFVRAAYDHDLDNNPLSVRVGPDAQSLAKVTLERPARSDWTATVGASHPMGKDGFLTIAIGQNGPSDSRQGTTFGVSYRTTF